MTRLWALLLKEVTDLRANPALFLPAVLTAVVSMSSPFVIALAVPRMSGEPLSASADFEVALQVYGRDPALAGLTPEGAVQAWIFRQFLVMLVFAPIAAAMSVAAYSVVGEKQARTLEPLLATPLTTTELLGAKILGALLPALALTTACYVAYFLAVRFAAEAGVHRVLLTGPSLSVVFVLGPLTALAALQMAVCVSSRVNDARSAQQIGALVILPLTALLVAQLLGGVILTPRMVLTAGIALSALNVALTRVGVALFDRESILTKWK